MVLRSRPKYNLDPRTKLILIVLANVLMFSYGPSIYLHALTILAILLTMICGKAKEGIQFSLFCIVFYAINYLMSFAPPTINMIWGSTMLSVMLFMPLYAIAFLAFTTTDISELITAFQKMKIPNVIITPLIVMFRFFPTLFLELKAIRDAMKLKGIKKNPIKLLEYVYAPVLFNSVRLSEELNISGSTRGLGLYKTATQTTTIKFGLLDFIAIAIVVCLILLRRGIIVL